MDDDGSLGIRNWGYYEQPSKGNLGLQLMSSMAERDTKPLLSNGGFLHHRDCGVPSMSMDFVRDSWIHHGRDNKLLHVHPHPNYSMMLPKPASSHTLQMMQSPEPANDEKPLHPHVDEPKKRPQGPPTKQPKPRKPKKAASPGDEATSCPRPKAGKKNTGFVINGIDLDISGIPTPVCSCTGIPQQCYRWGIGGWQSACCTTNMSAYPLPMSTKRRGARIAGRKMSQGAFKKVLEKIAGEGYNISNAIDLKMFWAKHGTNKFVTIR